MLSRRLLITTAAAAGLGACAGVPGGTPGGASTAAPASTTGNPLLAEFFERQFEDGIVRSPELATSLGDKRGYDRWDDDSLEAEAGELARRVAANSALQRLAGPLTLGAQDRLSVRLFGKQTDRAVASGRFISHTYLFNQMFGTHTGIPTFLANQHAVASLSDAQAYIARLEGAGAKLDTHRQRSEASAAAGLTPPKHIYDYVLSDCRNLLAGAPFTEGGTDAPMWASAQAKINSLSVDDATKTRLKAEARSALLSSVKPAYERLIASLETQKAAARTTDGVWALRDGEAYYAERLVNQTTTSLSANEIHQIGLDAVARIHGEMGAIMRRVGFTGTRDAFFDDLETNPRFFVSDDAAGRARYIREATALIDTMRTRLPEVFNVMPKAPMEVRAVEAFRERSAGLAFYQRPSPDGTRPGIYYINTYNVKAIPTYQMEALAYHEGIPGHHMQIAIAQELEGIPRFRKFGGFTAYSEGWALYTELLPKEMGFYSDPYSDFGRLVLELRRAIRLVVDTGLHAKRWPRQQAIDYILANQPGDLPSAERDIDRYIVMPGQATAYLIGQMEILRLREAARARQGARFDIRRFHDVVLTNGAVPLDVLAGLVGEMG
jgi:uncharacterized protein (DUF885 family)